MTTTATLTVPMPSLGENVTEGTVTRWLKQPGDNVELEEALLEVATDKVDTEIPSPAAGFLTEILANEDDVVEVGAALAVIALPGRDPAVAVTPAHEPAATPAPEPAPKATKPVKTTAEPTPTPAPAAPTPASPTSTAHAVGDRVEKLPRIRRTIAARMVESLQNSAQLTTVVEVDISAIAHLRREHKDSFLRRTGHKLSYLPFFAKAAVEALADNPVVNSSLDADVTTVTYHRSCHLGMAVDSEKGLVVPVIRDAQNLTIAGMAEATAAVADRVRTGKTGADELTGGTFTITNTGSRGALFDTPIINQPQSAILGTGTVIEKLVPRYRHGNLMISVASMVYLAISYDHRIVDGADAARYLCDVKAQLERGYTEADLF